ncbi:MAG: DNA polymerase I [Spirochaetota bacterium]|nr:DNA polymerase I [Spirochaetota bacterium]
MRKRLFVIDGHALSYRAYYAFIKNPLTNSKGQNTSAIYGFARMLLKLIDEESPDYLIVAFDPPGRSFRFRLYPEYKANRQKMPDDLRPQIDEIKNMLSIMGIMCIVEEDYEADDVLGTIAKKYSGKDIEVVLVTGDKDAYQLVNDNVKIYANKRGITEFEIYDVKGVTEKLGIRPDQVIDYMALMGDSTDNIPGVLGIGEKTAQKLIGQYDHLEGVYEHIDEIKGAKIKESILNNQEMAFLSRDLVTIRDSLPIEIDIDKIAKPDLNSDKTKEYFYKMEMMSIIKERFPEEEGREIEEKSDIRKDYRIISSRNDLEGVIYLINQKGEVSIDTETTSLHPIEAELVGISLSINENEGWYIPIRGHMDDVNITKESSLDLLRQALEDPEIKKIGQNIKYDIIILKNEGIDMKGIFFDTMVASYLLNPTERRHNLDDLAWKYLNYKTISYEELVGKGKKAISIIDVPLDRLSEYAIEDADVAYRLYKILKHKLKEGMLDRLFYDIEMPLVNVLATMEWNGVRVDLNYFEDLSIENQRLLGEVEETIYSIVGERFNINSTRELSRILFEKLGLKPVKKTKTGFSTDITVLEALKARHEIIPHLISYRTLSKLKNTYTDSLPKITSRKTGRIHTSYNQTVVATGRLSSSDPNLQNIPIKDEFGKRIRRAFVSDKECLLLSADYSQIELRLAAHLSEDENMIKAFKEGMDIHNLTASNIFHTAIGSITNEMRRQAKIINFATIYGVSPYGLSQQADISVKEAAEFIKMYFEIYPGFKRYVEESIAFARENGYVTTLLGRKRFIPEINSESSFAREGAERIAINTPIQGASADLIKRAMINIQKRLCQEDYNSRMILQVHDELVFEVPIEEKDDMERVVRIEMEEAIILKVPVIVDVGWGKTWAEAH